MNPVIGLDISKGESHAQAFLDRGVPHGKIFRFNHDLEGLVSFLIYIRGVESTAGMRPSIVMEATGHYHSPVVQFLDEHQYLNIVINPLISHNAKKTNLRRKRQTRRCIETEKPMVHEDPQALRYVQCC